MSTTTTHKNGVDVQKLVSFVDEVTREPWKARIAFKVRSEWMGGLRAKHTVSTYEIGDEGHAHITEHSITSDEPEEVLGKDQGISPSELILSALGACLTVGYAANAAAMGIDLQELRLELTARGDLQGFMNLNGVRPGFDEIAVKASVRSAASEEQLRQLHDYVNAHSPIWDTICNPVKVSSELETSV